MTRCIFLVPRRGASLLFNFIFFSNIILHFIYRLYHIDKIKHGNNAIRRKESTMESLKNHYKILKSAMRSLSHNDLYCRESIFDSLCKQQGMSVALDATLLNLADYFKLHRIIISELLPETTPSAYAMRKYREDLVDDE